MFSELLTKMQNNPSFYIMTLVAIIVLSIVAYLVYNNMKSSIQTQLNPEAVSNTTGSNDAEIMFFFANWCPHCKAAKPHWNEVKSQYDGKVVNGYKLTFTDIDCTEETPEVKKSTDMYEIEGYPTIKLIKDGQVIDYDAKPTKDTLEKFINTVM